MLTILVTGSKGLVGRKLCELLREQGVAVLELDINGESDEYGNVINYDDVATRASGIDGIVHLAAVSRVVWGEKDPEKCWQTNVTGTTNVVRAALESTRNPWVLFASSREVYGEIGNVPITESAPYAPASIYGNTKVEAEKLLLAATTQGLLTGIVRLSNVYGSPQDHADRVIPAFVNAALEGKPLKVEGGENHYDFTHLDDTVDGIIRYIDALNQGKVLTPIHLLTGVSTSLLDLANKTIALLKSNSKIEHCTPRDYGSGKFLGDNANARKLLGWEPKIDLETGIGMLAAAISETGSAK